MESKKNTNVAKNVAEGTATHVHPFYYTLYTVTICSQASTPDGMRVLHKNEMQQQNNGRQVGLNIRV
jgi:hypothetical protein